MLNNDLCILARVSEEFFWADLKAFKTCCVKEQRIRKLEAIRIILSLTFTKDKLRMLLSVAWNGGYFLHQVRILFQSFKECIFRLKILLTPIARID